MTWFTYNFVVLIIIYCHLFYLFIECNVQPYFAVNTEGGRLEPKRTDAADTKSGFE